MTGQRPENSPVNSDIEKGLIEQALKWPKQEQPPGCFALISESDDNSEKIKSGQCKVGNQDHPRVSRHACAFCHRFKAHINKGAKDNQICDRREQRQSDTKNSQIGYRDEPDRLALTCGAAMLPGRLHHSERPAKPLAEKSPQRPW